MLRNSYGANRRGSQMPFGSMYGNPYAPRQAAPRRGSYAAEQAALEYAAKQQAAREAAAKQQAQREAAAREAAAKQQAQREAAAREAVAKKQAAAREAAARQQAQREAIAQQQAARQAQAAMQTQAARNPFYDSLNSRVGASMPAFANDRARFNDMKLKGKNQKAAEAEVKAAATAKAQAAEEAKAKAAADEELAAEAADGASVPADKAAAAAQKETLDEDRIILDAEAVIEDALADENGAASDPASNAELEAAKKEASDWQDRYMRLHAEWDTYRRRTNEERAEEKTRATQKLIEDLLPVLDDFERTVTYATENGETGLLDGVKAVQTKFVDALVKDGLVVLDPVGEPYDALEAQAVATIPDAEAYDETVKEVYQKGYKLGNKVIRPAMVTVTTGGPARPKPEDE